MPDRHDPREFIELIDSRYRETAVSARLKAHADSDEDLLPRTFEELHATIEELRLAQEHLRIQCDELAVWQQATELHKKRFEELFQLAPNAFVITDRQGMILNANVAARTLLGTSLLSNVDKPLASCVLASDRRLLETACPQ